MGTNLEKTLVALVKTGTDLNLEKLETTMLKEQQVECPVYHHFYPGIYMREVHMKAGSFAIGHFQKTEHLNFFLRGKVHFIETDKASKILTAPMIFMSKPGRKVGLILEDVVWFNIYPTEETDIDKLEETYLSTSIEWEEAQVSQVSKMQDIIDYREMLAEYNLTELQVRAESERTEDLISFPEGVTLVKISNSPIEGKGVFATANIEEGAIIAPGRIDGNRTPAGRYVNHAKEPTATISKTGNLVNFIALKRIQGMTGGQLGDEITINYREAIRLER